MAASVEKQDGFNSNIIIGTPNHVFSHVAPSGCMHIFPCQCGAHLVIFQD